MSPRQTPLGICAAVGTVFNVGYQAPSPIDKAQDLEVVSGAVTYDGEGLKTQAIPGGGSISMVATAKKPCSRKIKLTITGQPLLLTLGGKHKVLVDPGTELEVGMPDEDGKTDFVAVSVTAGQASVGGKQLKAGDTPSFVEGDDVMAGEDATPYFAAMTRCFDAVGDGTQEIPPEVWLKLMQEQEEATPETRPGGDTQFPIRRELNDIPDSPGGLP